MKWMILASALMLFTNLLVACGENSAGETASDKKRIEVDAVVRYAGDVHTPPGPHPHGGAPLTSLSPVLCLACLLVTGAIVLMAKKQ